MRCDKDDWNELYQCKNSATWKSVNTCFNGVVAVRYVCDEHKGPKTDFSKFGWNVKYENIVSK